MPPAGDMLGASTFAAFANAIWLTASVSPRSASMPAALETAFCSAGSSAAGTDLSTISATLSLFTAPGATFVRMTVLSTPNWRVVDLRS